MKMKFTASSYMFPPNYEAHQSKNNQTCFPYIDKATFSAVQVTAVQYKCSYLFVTKKQQSQSHPAETVVQMNSKHKHILKEKPY